MIYGTDDELGQFFIPNAPVCQLLALPAPRLGLRKRPAAALEMAGAGEMTAGQAARKWISASGRPMR